MRCLPFIGGLPWPDDKLELVVTDWYSRFQASGIDDLHLRETLARIQRWHLWAREWAASAEVWQPPGRASPLPARARSPPMSACSVLPHVAVRPVRADRGRRAASGHSPPSDRAVHQVCAAAGPAGPAGVDAVRGHRGAPLPAPPGQRRTSSPGIPIPGLESTKEQFSTFEPNSSQRGIATRSLGTRAGRTVVEHASSHADYQRAVTVVPELAPSLDDVDAGGLTVVGTSFGA